MSGRAKRVAVAKPTYEEVQSDEDMELVDKEIQSSRNGAVGDAYGTGGQSELCGEISARKQQN